MIGYLADNWRKAGVNSGDTLLLHSNLTRTIRQARRQQLTVGAADVLESLLSVLGPQGTLVLPLFNFDFPSTRCFDIRSTPSQMGALTEAARLHPGSVRTGHPIYSFAIIGRHAQQFSGIDNESGYAEDSPFGLVKRLGGKIGSLDLDDQHSMTFYHHVEESKQVPYRYFKQFSGQYTDQNGETMNKTYRLFVRDLQHGVQTDVNPAGELMWQQGLYTGFRPGVDVGLRTVRAQAMFDFVARLIDEQQALGTLYSIGEAA